MFAPLEGMNEALRRFALSGLESQKQGLAGRIRQAAAHARDGVDHRDAAGGLAHWLADRLDGAAGAVESRDVEGWIHEVRALARRHPAATAAVAAAAAFALTRLALPADGVRRAGRGVREGGTYA